MAHYGVGSIRPGCRELLLTPETRLCSDTRSMIGESISRACAFGLAAATAAALSTPAPSRAQMISEIIDSTGDGFGNALDFPEGITLDASGNVYVAARDTDNVFRIAPDGVVVEIVDGTGDGAGKILDDARDVVLDGAGNVYVTGFESDNAFRITPGGVVTEIIDATGDGSGATLDGPLGVAVDGADNVYVAGAESNNAFKVSPGGAITQIIDSTGDGLGNVLMRASYLAVDGVGNVYVTGADSDNAFKIDPGGVVTEIIDDLGDGVGNALEFPRGVAVDSAGNVYVSAVFSSNAFKIEPGGTVTKIIDGAGNGEPNSLIYAPGLVVDAADNVYVSGGQSDNVFRVTPDGVITEIIDASGDDAGNPLFNPVRIAVDDAGVVYVAGRDSDNAFKISRCPQSPATECTSAGLARLDMKEKRPGNEKIKLRWRRLLDATTRTGFGDPVFGATAVAICVYDDVDVLVADLVVSRAGEGCPNVPCWKAPGTQRYDYRDKHKAADGISRVAYKAGDAGKGKALANGSNDRGKTALPAGMVARLTGSTAPTVQMLTTDGFCATATMNEVVTDEPTRYRAQLE